MSKSFKTLRARRYNSKELCYFTTQVPEIKELKKKNYKEKTGFDTPFHNPYVQDCRKNSHKLTGSMGFSVVSQELFWSIFNQLPVELQNETYFATFGKEFAMYDFENNTGYYYDFSLVYLKFIIEFDGKYWHNEKTEKRDIQKQKFIEGMGFEVIRIKEQDYYDNKINVITECLNKIIEYSLIKELKK